MRGSALQTTGLDERAATSVIEGSGCPARAGGIAPAIVVSHVCKSYPNGVVALDDVSLSVPQRQIVGLLGPNGAGKSTLIRILCGVTAPSSGSVLVYGFDPSTHPRAVKEHLCGLFQSSPIEPKAHVREVLWLFSQFYERPVDVDELLDRVGLMDVRDRQCRTLSGGQRQRLAIARALIGNPRVLILDEPTSGLDVAARNELMEILNRLREEGRAIVISTHNIDEAETWCDQVAIVSRGKVFAVDTPKTIIEQYGARARLEVRVGDSLSISRVKSLPGVVDAKAIHSAPPGFGPGPGGMPRGPGGMPGPPKNAPLVQSPAADPRMAKEFLLEGVDAEALLVQFVRMLAEVGGTLKGARLIQSGLESAYLKLTGERIQP